MKFKLPGLVIIFILRNSAYVVLEHPRHLARLQLLKQMAKLYDKCQDDYESHGFIEIELCVPKPPTMKISENIM